MMKYKSIFQHIAPTFNKKPPFVVPSFNKKPPFVVPSFHKGGVRGGSCNLTDPQPPNLGGLGGVRGGSCNVSPFVVPSFPFPLPWEGLGVGSTLIFLFLLTSCSNDDNPQLSTPNKRLSTLNPQLSTLNAPSKPCFNGCTATT